MIKFFRRIRQNLLNEGKTSKYFKYAIGEIVLVVIGILIALQINNWNENRKEQVQELNLVKQLFEDAKNDSIFFQSRLQLFSAQMTTYEQLTDFCEGKINSNDSIVFRNGTYPFMVAADQSIVISNKDDYNKISNEAIKKTLRDYALSYNYVSKSISLHSNVIIKENQNLTKTYNLTRDFEELSLNDMSGICQEPNISGILTLCWGVTLNARKQVERFIIDNKKLIEVCNKYLND
jgi:hypothetical protein